MFAKWRDDAPEDFVFAIKAPRYLTYRKVLSEAIDSIAQFLGQRPVRAATEARPDSLAAAAEPALRCRRHRQIPGSAARRRWTACRLRHVLEVRHKSFMDPAYVELAKKHSVATVFAHTDEFPNFADVTADFVYARLRKAMATEPTGYSKPDLQAWSERAQLWAAGGAPDDLPYVTNTKPPKKPRDVYIFFINGAKERAPGGREASVDAALTAVTSTAGICKPRTTPRSSPGTRPCRITRLLLSVSSSSTGATMR